jgi:hypothetical protein
VLQVARCLGHAGVQGGTSRIPEPTAARVRRLFGDFAYTELEGGRIRIEPGWVEENIVTVEIPQLARVTSDRVRTTGRTRIATSLLRKPRGGGYCIPLTA